MERGGARRGWVRGWELMMVKHFQFDFQIWDYQYISLHSQNLQERFNILLFHSKQSYSTKWILVYYKGKALLRC